MKKIVYSQVGDNYDTKDPIKKLAQAAAERVKREMKAIGTKNEFG